ncbi:hypothetical protein EDD22DRAFT_987778 [Suillus occidentalis]|nr:hypothetical protein EDD22DRAFT_987778 [Suillus occidentalis]
MPQFPPVPSHVRPYPPDPHAHLYNQFAHAAHPVYGRPYAVYPQHWGLYPPASQGAGVPLAPAQLSRPSASYPAHPPQHWGGYPPASQGVGVPLAPAQLSHPSASYPAHPPQHWGGYPPASRGAGVPLAPAQLSYPSAPPSVQSFYNQHHTQGLGQQAPAPPFYPAASPLLKKALSSVDDAPPSKRQAIQPRVDDFNIIPINGSISRGGSSNIGSSSKTQEEVVAQVPCEASTSSKKFADGFEDYDWTSSGPLEELVNSLDQSELAWDEQVKEFFDIIQKAADAAPGELEVVNTAQETDNSASDNLLEGFTNSVDSASGWQSQESINSPDETADLAPDDLMNSFVKAEDPELVGKLLKKLIDQWLP